MAVEVLGEFPHEDAAEVVLAYGIADFRRRRGWAVVGDEAEGCIHRIQQIGSLSNIVEILGPGAGGYQLLDLHVGYGWNSEIAAVSVVGAERPEAIDIEGISIESGAQIDLLGGNVELASRPAGRHR